MSKTRTEYLIHGRWVRVEWFKGLAEATREVEELTPTVAAATVEEEPFFSAAWYESIQNQLKAMQAENQQLREQAAQLSQKSADSVTGEVTFEELYEALDDKRMTGQMGIKSLIWHLYRKDAIETLQDRFVINKKDRDRGIVITGEPVRQEPEIKITDVLPCFEKLKYEQSFKLRIAEILKDNIYFVPQAGDYAIFGALDKTWELHHQHLRRAFAAGWNAREAKDPTGTQCNPDADLEKFYEQLNQKDEEKG